MKLSPQAVVGRRNGLCILLGCFAIASNALVGFASDEALLGDELHDVYYDFLSNIVEESTEPGFTNENSDSSYLLRMAGIPEPNATPVAAEFIQHEDESFAEEPTSISSDEDKAPGSGTDNRRLAEEDRSTSEVPEVLPVPEKMEVKASPPTDHESETMTSQDELETGTEDRRLTSDNRRLAEEDRSTSEVPEELPVPEKMEVKASPPTDESETMTSQDELETGTEDRRLTSDNRRLAEEDRSTSEVPEELPVPEEMEVNASPPTDLESETMTSQDELEAGTEHRHLTSVQDTEPAGEIVNESHIEDEEPFGLEGSELEPVVKAGEQVIPTGASGHHEQMKNDATPEDADELQSVSSRRRLDGDGDEIEDPEGDDEELDLARASTGPEEAEHEPLPETGLENQSVPDDNADDEEAIVTQTEGAASLRRRLADGSSVEPVQPYCGEACHTTDDSSPVDNLPVDNAADATPKTDGYLRGTPVAQDTVPFSDFQAEGSVEVSSV